MFLCLPLYVSASFIPVGLCNITGCSTQPLLCRSALPFSCASSRDSSLLPPKAPPHPWPRKVTKRILRLMEKNELRMSERMEMSNG
ncbi:hypothetical protein B0O80DRAFT_449311 [Mortierella sp. GBAus27b]|nr:hypothetical protein B0O80DRAFT_449311 [Mortierella sp. GBAus27b]